MDDNCGEWVEFMDVVSRRQCGYSGSGWNLCVWLVGVVVRRYIDFIILLIHPYSSCIFSFLQQHPYFLCFSFLFQYFFCK